MTIESLARRPFTVALALCAGLSLCSLDAVAYSRGTTGRSVTGCLGIIPSCHNDTMSMRNGAMVAIEGPATLAAGERATYTLRVSRTDMGTLAVAGLDVRASGGGLRPNGANTRIESCELTHSVPIAPTMAGATEVRIPFDFIAPANATTVTLQAAANGADGNGTMAGANGQTGDQWGTTSFSVMVTGSSDAGGACLPDPLPDASAPDAADASDAAIDGSDSSVEDGGADADASANDSSPITDAGADAAADGGVRPPPMNCQCTVSGASRGGSRGALALIVGAVALAIRARRRSR
ncbi:MAG: choice-of-anchor V domain-containing protein [Polyangiales bacterium]